jgi:RNA polymerase sigma-70 factor (ECF subfamily)
MLSSPIESGCHDPDAELVRSCQAGGTDAAISFARLIDRHGARIQRRAARILGDDSEAEDVVQEVFLNVHRFIDRYQPDRPFGHWLSVVTLNACRIELRRRHGRDRRHEAYRTDPAQRWTTTLDGDPILREWLEQALDELHPVTRQCILLRALDGFGYREIARRAGLSEPAAKMRVLRGLRDLRSRYALHEAREERARTRRDEADAAALVAA